MIKALKNDLINKKLFYPFLRVALGQEMMDPNLLLLYDDFDK